MGKSSKPVLIITPGDPAGVGPEITVKALQSKALSQTLKKFDILCVGASAPFRKMGIPLKLATYDGLGRLELSSSSRGIHFLEAPEKAPRKTLLAGFQSGWSIVTAVQLIQKGYAQALVTGPISKERLQRGGFAYFGHTDLLADLCGVDEKFTMMLANDLIKVSLVTSHLSLRDVPSAVTRPRIRRAVNQTIEALDLWWKVKKPRIAVAALNPHAGEGGILGHEEQKVITPEIRFLQKKWRGRAEIVGPLPSDTLFAQHCWGNQRDRFDAVVCMYHDQGLIPAKTLDFPNTVNVTLGLPIIRTSVDHGTAFDIAGKNIADPSSMRAAITLAAQLIRQPHSIGAKP